MTQLPPRVERQDLPPSRRPRSTATVRSWIVASAVAFALLLAVGPEPTLRLAAGAVTIDSAAQPTSETATDRTVGAASSPSLNPTSDGPYVRGTAVVRRPAEGLAIDEPTMLNPTSQRVDAEDTVFVLGDSVMLGAKWAIPKALAEWNIIFDARGSRRLPQGIEILAERRGEIGRILVMMFGNNLIPGERGSFGDQIDEVMAMFPDLDLVVWFTVAETSETRVAINEAIRAAAQRHSNLATADWAPVIEANADYAAEDRLHLGPAGARALADLVRAEIDAAGLQPIKSVTPSAPTTTATTVD